MNREVVGLSTTAGENNLTRIGTDERGDLRARRLELATRRLPRAMHRRRIAAVLLEEARDGGLHLGSQRRAGIMVQVGTHRHCY